MSEAVPGFKEQTMARQLPNDAFSKSSFLYGGNATYVEQLYDAYRRDPAQVDPSWRQFFEGLKDDVAGPLLRVPVSGGSIGRGISPAIPPATAKRLK